MKTRIFLFLTLFFSADLLCLAQSSVYAIKNVNVIPMDQEGFLKNQTIVIENGKIKALGDHQKIKIPKGAIEINGENKYVIPGLFDMHAHFFYEQGDNVNTCELELKMMLANGVTTARIQNGDQEYLKAKQNVREKKWAGPELSVSSPQFLGRWPWPDKVFAFVCATPEEAEAAVKNAKSEGYDEIKITFMIERPVYDAIIKASKEAGMKVTGHVGPKVKLPVALAAHQQIEHMDEFIEMLLPDTSYNHGESVSDMNIWRKRAWETVPSLDENKIPALVKMVKESGIYVTPTNYFFFSSFGYGMTEDQIKQKPDFNFIPANIKAERWETRNHFWKNPPPQASRDRYVAVRRKITGELWKNGVKLMAGSDSPEWFLVQGVSIHDELETFVSCGLTPWAAIETATVNPSRYLGFDSRTGTITKGKEADLLLLDKNPLEDIRNTRSINSIFNGGKYYSKADVDGLLKEASALGTN